MLNYRETLTYLRRWGHGVLAQQVQRERRGSWAE